MFPIFMVVFVCFTVVPGNVIATEIVKLCEEGLLTPFKRVPPIK